ncbi:MAG: endonuclease domain-containing protein [Sphingobium sp.]
MARRLRRQMSLPEVLLWTRLRRPVAGPKFRRQHPVGPYIADFYCASARLIVEIDGEAHNRADRPERDARRDQWLSAAGYRILRMSACEVLADVDSAADAIMSIALPLHHRAVPGGPPPHAMHGEDFGLAPE